jgi:hypothetical protein
MGTSSIITIIMIIFVRLCNSNEEVSVEDDETLVINPKVGEKVHRPMFDAM